MKKLFMLILVTGITSSLLADMRYDTATGLAYTIPATPDINLDEYRNLCSQIAVMTILAMNAGKLGTEIKNQEDSFLESMGTPTALRLLADLKKPR